MGVSMVEKHCQKRAYFLDERAKSGYNARTIPLYMAMFL
jgi:hypothetical protein